MLELFKIIGTIAVNNRDAIDSMNETVGLGQSMATKLGGFAATAGKAIVTAASAAAAGIGAMATGIATITKSAVDNYGEYEQLVGGSKLMFGDAYDFIAEKAANAFNTVQMSQNDYLQQVNGFATGLKTALDGDEMAAAELADKILTAEADVVAATGNSQEAVQNAFNGIMKSNYTMLDNLQLGIKPTKEGMQEVIDKVNEWNAANGIASEYVIDNLADCQAALVDYISMQGLAGYATNEAAGTIQGSMSSVKAAWDNLMTGFADPDQDIDKLLNNFIASAEAFLDNMLPRISQAIPRVIQGLSSMIQQAAGYVPDLLKDILPALIDGAITLLTELATNLPAIIQQVLPPLIEGVKTLFTSLFAALPDILNELLPDDLGANLGNTIKTVFENLFSLGEEVLPMLMNTISQIFPMLMEAANSILPVLVSFLEKILPFAATLISELLPRIIPILQPVLNLLDPLLSLLDPILNLILALLPPLTWLLEQCVPAMIEVIDMLTKVIEGAYNILSGTVNFWLAVFSGDLQGALDACLQTLKGFWDMIVGLFGIQFAGIITMFKSELFEPVLNFFKDLFVKAKDIIVNGFEAWLTITTTVFTAIKQKISDTITDAIETVKSGIEKIKGFFDFKWKLPDLKMPHFKVEGEFSLNPLKVPTFGVDWYAKAMDNPMLLTQPTAFGINAAGQIMAGGENGAEVVSGADTLMNMIASTVSAQNKELIDVLTHILSAVVSMDDNMGNNMREAIEGTTLSVGNREFARLVRGVV